ncbi:MAG: hypothetical protein EBU90_06610 [Proteobacteria bacterium]|nr:hypothetical protein [Pseudomonadota bacterium]NBP15067.1 hypothetical protein [bacterium]
MSKNNTKTINPKLADINYTSNIELLKETSNYLDLITGIEDGVKISLDYYIAITKNDLVKSLSDFYKKLDSEQMPLLSNDFVDFWVNRFKSTTEKIKELIKQEINVDDNSFFTELSDSVGLLLNSKNLLDDATIPYFDYKSTIYKQPPNVIPLQLKNKVSSITKEVINSLSTNNTALLKYNLKRINLTTNNTNPSTDSSSPHGVNLITDINSYIIINRNISLPWFKLIQKYKKIYSYINFLSNIGNQEGYNPRNLETNKQIITDLIFSFNIEKIKQSLDLLQRKYINILSYKTIKNTISNQTTETDTPNNTILP